MPSKTAKTIAPFGLWPSPISAADLARSGRSFGHREGNGGWLYWAEARPAEKGRQVIMRARPQGPLEELLPAPFSARSRVHEYGGAEFSVAGETLYFVNDSDQDIWRLVTGLPPERLTNEPPMRFAAIVLDPPRQRLLAVAEIHREAGGPAHPDNLIVAIPLAGADRGKVQPLLAGRDFYAFPALSPNGTRLAFLAWDLPDMPWDQAGLYVAPVRANGEIGRPKRIAGGNGVAAMQPLWLADGRLVFAEDASGWGNLAIWDGRAVRALTSLEFDLGVPMWNLGTRSFVVDSSGRMQASGSVEGKPVLVVVTGLSDREPTVTVHPTRLAGLGGLATVDGGVGGTLSRDKAPPALGMVPAGRRSPVMLRTSTDLALDPAGVSVGKEVSFRGGDGSTTFARYYPPTSSTHRGPSSAAPPALVLAHGGPTGAAPRGLSLRVQFYTSRGFAVIDVDYAGSTGYGRAYRQRLDGQWGIADVADCAAAAAWLAEQELADPARVAIAGGSAGGYTVLMALATTSAFAAGASHYGISDLSLLMENTHKFEAGYLHRLLGTTASTWRNTALARSPLTLIDGISAPVVLFQGLEDKVVPPEQSRLIAERLKSRGVPVALHEYPGEGHGFRRAKTIIAVLETEVGFLRDALRLG